MILNNEQLLDLFKNDYETSRHVKIQGQYYTMYLEYLTDLSGQTNYLVNIKELESLLQYLMLSSIQELNGMGGFTINVYLQNSETELYIIKTLSFEIKPVIPKHPESFTDLVDVGEFIIEKTHLKYIKRFEM